MSELEPEIQRVLQPRTTEGVAEVNGENMQAKLPKQPSPSNLTPSSSRPSASAVPLSQTTASDHRTGRVFNRQYQQQNERQQEPPSPVTQLPKTKTKEKPIAIANNVSATITKNPTEREPGPDLTEQELLLAADPCEQIMCKGITLESLGWHFEYVELEKLRAIQIQQDLASQSQQSDNQKPKAGNLISSLLSSLSTPLLKVIPGKTIATSSETENDESAYESANVEPHFLNSPHLQRSFLQKVEGHRQNTRAIFHTRQVESDLWRLMINSIQPSGLQYLNEAWLKWQKLSGGVAIPSRFNRLSTFKGQSTVETVFPNYEPLSGMIRSGRFHYLRESIFKRVCKHATPLFPKLLGCRPWPTGLRSWVWWPRLSDCTLENLEKNDTTLHDLFAQIPHDSITILDLIFLFELKPLPFFGARRKDERRQNQEEEDGDGIGPAPEWLSQLDYVPFMHFEYSVKRFPVSTLIHPPICLNWLHVRSFITAYYRISNWQAFFSPLELRNLGFSFKQELVMSQAAPQSYNVLSADIFRIMADKGTWIYEDLVKNLDFTPEVISELQLTQLDLKGLGWRKKSAGKIITTSTAITLEKVEDEEEEIYEEYYEEGEQEGDKEEEQDPSQTQWLTQSQFDDLQFGDNKLINLSQARRRESAILKQKLRAHAKERKRIETEKVRAEAIEEINNLEPDSD